MPKFKLPGFGAEDAKAEAGSFAPYEGELPPKKSILRGVVKRMQMKLNSNEDPMINFVVEVSEPEGSPKAKYNRCPAWHNVNVTEQGKGYVNQFFRALGMSNSDIVSFWSQGPNLEKDKLPANFVAVGDFKISNRELPVRFMSTLGKYKGVARLEVDMFLETKGPQPDEVEDIEEAEAEAEVDDDEETVAQSDPDEGDAWETETDADGDPIDSDDDEEPVDDDPVDDEPPF